MRRVERDELYERALAAWGSDAQLRMLQEECGELIAAVNQYTRERIADATIAAEIADVLIMCEQARRIIGSDLVDSIMQMKLERLQVRVECADGKVASHG